MIFLLILIFGFSGAVSTKERHSHMPSPKLTPGDTLDMSVDELCNPRRADIDDNIPVTVKRQVFDRYGISGDRIGYNIDHLIPAKLGGSNSIKNLWPQPISGEWSHHRKNQLERRLLKLVCSGSLDLRKAQQEIAADWVSAYKKYIGDPVEKRSSRD